MKKRKPFFLFKPFWAAFIAIGMLSGCDGISASPYTNQNPEIITESTNDGTPTTISIQQKDHIDPPADFDTRDDYVVEDPEQNEKFVLDGQPGEYVTIVNPSDEAIAAEDIEKAVTIRDAFADPTTPTDPTRKYLQQKNAPTPSKRFRVCDPQTKLPLKRVGPMKRAVLVTEDAPEGGDLTIYTKDEYLPINYEGKHSTVNELIVATTREDVEEFDPNDEDILGLVNSKVADFGDIDTKLEGSFLYKEEVKLHEGDQFYIGDHETFDHSSTFFTFLSCEKESSNYRIHYTAPDYSLCYSKFNVHKQNEPINFDSPDVQIKMPKTEDLIRELDKDGGIIDVYEEEVLADALLADPVIGPEIQRAFQPGIALTLVIDRLTVNVAINFATEGDSIVSNWSITISYAIKTKDAGTLVFRGGASYYIKKTFSTYMDYKIRWFPYPKLSYVVCMKSLDESSLTVTGGLAGAMNNGKEEDDPYDPGAQADALKQAIKDLLPKDMPKVEGGSDVPAPSDNAEPSSKIRTEVDPKMAIYGKDTGKDKYSYANNDGFDIGKAKFVGDGIVINGPGFVVASPYVCLEIGTSVSFMPNIQGKFFYNRNKVSNSIMCKVVNGFETPEGYEDDVECSNSTNTLGLYCQLGFEAGFLVEALVYVTGTKKIFNLSLGFYIGFYLTLSAVGILTWGDVNSVEGMGYFSVELGVLLRVQIRLNIGDGTAIIDIKTWSWKYPLLAFGTNLHFLNFVDDRKELEWMGGKYININDFGILAVQYFDVSQFAMHEAVVDWKYEAYFASAIVEFKLRLFCDLDILEGDQYIKFNDSRSCFEVLEGAPDQFDFKFKIYTDGWLGLTMPNKTVTVHYTSNEIRAINFLDYPGTPEYVDGAYLGGGALKQGEIYRAPTLPAKEDGTPFFGWVGNNGLYLAPGETMEVGAMNINFHAVYRDPYAYLVNFYDGKNNLIMTQKIIDGGTPEEPSPKIRDVYMEDATFIGWDRDFSSVHSDLHIYGIYAKGGKTA